MGVIDLRHAGEREPVTTMSPLFRPGERMCFLGDSITHTGTFHALVYLYHLTRFPGVEADLWNCGRAGGVTNQAIECHDHEIAPLRPTRAALMFGMNDCGRHRYGATHETPEDHASRTAHFTEFRLRTRLLVERLRAEGCRIILQTPTPYDQTATERPGFPAGGRVAPGLEHANDALARFAGWIREQAPRWEADVVDYHRPLTDLALRLQRADPGFSMTSDRVHLDPCWHLLVAYEFLVQQGMADIVSAVGLDAAVPRCDAVCRATVSDLRRGADGLSFTWHAAALPFPLDPLYAPVLRHVPFHERLNREILAITGLAGGRYDLFIDDERIATIAADELATGVNLALLPQTPQGRQARELARLNEERHALNVRLQDALLIDCWRPAGQSAEDALAAARQEAARAGVPGCEWIATVNQSFVELHGRERETRETLSAMMRELNTRNTPRPHRYRLRPTSDAVRFR